MSRADSPLRDSMVFVLGAPRSGTHWLQRIVAAHPDVAAIPAETFLFTDRGLGPLFDRFHHGALDSPQVGRLFVDRDVLLDSTRDLCDRAFSAHLRPGARFLVERTPLFADHVPLLSEVYPDARVAHIVRDGRDVARSILARGWGFSSAAEVAVLWRDAVAAGRGARCLGRYAELRYEQLLASPRETIVSLFAGLGLDASHEALEHASGEAGQHQNLDRTSPLAAAQKWREAMSWEEVHAFEAVAGDLLVELGYERTTEAGRVAPSPAPRRRHGIAPAHRIARRLSARRRRSSPGAGGASPSKESDIALDSVLSLVHRGQIERLPELLEPAVAVRIVAGGVRRELHGDAGRDALLDALRTDRAMRGRQLMGDVIPGGRNVTAVLTYELEDGMHADRVVVIAARGSRVRRLALYQLPPRPPGTGLAEAVAAERIVSSRADGD